MGLLSAVTLVNGQTFSNMDLGFPTIEGSVDASGDQVVVTAAGADIWGTADEGHFYYTTLEGGFDVVVRVVSLEGTHSWAKSGIMVREELDPAGRHVDIMTTRTDGQNITNVQWRDTFGGGSASKPGGERVGPVPYPNAWIRLTRADGNSNEFKGYLSEDGVSWGDPYHVYNMTEDTDGPFASDVFVGLAVTSHDAASEVVATFADFQILEAVAPSVTSQPSDQSVVAGASATFSVGVNDNASPPPTFQWTKNGTDVEGATGATWVIDRASVDDDGAKIAVVVSNSGGTVTSDEVTLSVSSDDVLPTITGVTGSEKFLAVRATFSEPVDAATANVAGNYSLSGGINVTSATVGAAPNDNIVTLVTSAQEVGTTLTLTVNNVTDIFGNAVAADSSMEFSTFIWQEGVVLHKFWQDTPNNIAGLIADPRFPDSPDFVTLEPMWEYGPGGINESGSNYGNQLVGWFIPPSDGEYIFFTNSDDPSELFLSTDDDPANKVLIAREAGWSNARNWVSTGGGASDIDDKRSDFFADSEWATFDITLEGGNRYYLESLHTEGGGGDSVAATVVSADEDDPVDGDAPTLTGSLIGTYLDPNGASITILQQPATKSVNEGRSTMLNIVVEGTSAYGNNVNIQWQQAAAGSADFTDIAGATTDTYETAVLTQADSGLQFRVNLSVPTVTATSDVATLTVINDTTAPKIVSVTANSLNSLIVKFDEDIDPAAGVVAANFSLSDGVSITSASVAGSSALLKTGSLVSDATYTVTVSGVSDLYGNVIAAGSTKSFVVSVVTYTDIILSDEPIAFYRFEETSGMVAENFGTLGSQADGLWMSGLGPDDSFEVEVSSETGPNPADGLLGFGDDNLAASFNGDFDLFWIETQGQWLSNLGSFTLEYWVKPTNREDGAWSRVGIVGQNDAVEYGFINGTTIQIWTPGGGALNTTYDFSDDEWHHIATIADGTQIHNYFDGELINSAGSATADYGSADFTVHIGGGGVYDGTGNHFEGGLDEVAIFDRAIPAARVKQHYTAGREGGSKAAPEVDPTVSIATDAGGNITIEFEGTLQSSDTVDGAYSDVAGAASPFSVAADAPQKFYRSVQ